MNPTVSRLARPSVLQAVDSPKPWGWELWLTSTRAEGPARLAGGQETLADLVTSHPETLGHWSRRLFGDAMPIFAKLIHSNFPRRVHLGFRRPVERGEVLARLQREQELLRELFCALRVRDERGFAEYQARYSDWASRQALSGWRRDDDDATASALAGFLDVAFELRSWLGRVRDNRAALVDTLNDVDLARESGHLLLSNAGVIHAIFGLSHQTHPRDRARTALQELFALLAGRAAAGASDEDLARTIDAAGLSSMRAPTASPPKNEAWFPTVVDGAEVLVEPQQTSDTTHSLADFYTPLVWSSDRVKFRKGAPETGLSIDELRSYLAEVEFTVTPIDSIRRAPKRVAGGEREGAILSCLVDEPTEWPFFTAYQLDLTGRFTAAPPPGVCQQLVVTRGSVELSDEAGVVGQLSPRAPAFVPATFAGSYTLVAREPSIVLQFAVPGARGGAPRIQ